MECELCDLVANPPEHIYYANKEVLIVTCRTCQIPMLVFRHCGEATPDEKRHAINIVNELFDYDQIRFEARQIKNHEHWHIYGRLKK